MHRSQAVVKTKRTKFNYKTEQLQPRSYDGFDDLDDVDLIRIRESKDVLEEEEERLP